MSFTLEQLTHIVEKSSTLHQRLNGSFEQNIPEIHSKETEKRSIIWQEVVAFNNPTLFEKRFRWDGLELSSTQRIMGVVTWKKEKPLPSWTALLEEISEATNRLSVTNLDSTMRSYWPETGAYPFQELFVPFILVARRKLQELAGSSYSRLSDTAHAALERQLLQRLSHVSEQTLYLEFSILRAKKQSRLATQLKGKNISNRGLYFSFVQQHFDTHFVPFFMEYTVLARLLSTAVAFWVTNSAELLQRVVTDWPAICTMFGLSEAADVVTAVQTNLSDPHNNGRSVSILTFSSGFKLVYKPKDLGMEVAFTGLIQWVNNQNLSMSLKAIKILNHPGYGWVEYVEAASCQDESAVKRYYHRIGMLLCLVYLLEGTDCHNENLMAVGEHPVLIDAETLLHPRVTPVGSEEATNGAQNLAYQQFLNSVIRTGFLPVWLFGRAGQSYDISGLGTMAGQEVPYQQIRWFDVNTDQMSLRRATTYAKTGASAPTLNDTPVSANHYLTEIIQGFSEVYDLLLKHSKEGTRILESFIHQNGRFLFRNTINYFLLLEKLLQPKFMRDGIDRSIQLDVLYRAAIGAKHKPHFWPLIEMELKTMESLDVPYFTSYTMDTAVSTSAQIILENYFTQSGYDLIQEHFKSLNQADKDLQIGLIQAVFKLRFQDVKSPFALVPVAEIEKNQLTPASQLELEQVALDIAADIAKQAIIARNGSVSWLGLEYVAEADRSIIQPLGHNLHSGNCGVALFLASLEKISPEVGYRHLALGALHQVCLPLREAGRDNQIMSQRMSIGGAIGLGSIIYTLTKISHFLGEPALLEDAKLAASCITPERISTDTKYDVMDGSAGALLGLIALYEKTAESQILQQAIICGEHLLSHRTTSQFGYRVWATASAQLLTGFSHGAAGIAYALLRLYHITKQEKFCEAALEAISYENSLYSLAEQNWPDLLRSKENKPVYGATWCHGAPGIGLARLGSLQIINTSTIHQDVQLALQSTEKMFTDGLDTLCCGNLGRSELFVAAGHNLQRPELLEKATHQATLIIKHKETTGAFQMPYGLGDYSHAFQLGFFHGLAGIGYQILRIAHPALLPSVMLWQ